MPYKTEWVPAELFLTEQGVMVFHAYAEDEFDDRRTNYYMWDANGDEGDAFDVRELPEYGEGQTSHEEVLKTFIRRCVAAGLDPARESPGL